MSITWGLNGDGIATVFCRSCLAVFGSTERNTVWKAQQMATAAAASHYCTPPRQWKPANQRGETPK